MAVYDARRAVDGDGVFPDAFTGIRMQNRTGGDVVRGQVVQLDIFAEDAGTTESVPGRAGSIWNGFIDPTAEGVEAGAGPLAVVEAAAADDAYTTVTLKGCDVDVLVDHLTTGNVVLGSKLGAIAASGALRAFASAADVVFGIGAKGTVAVTSTDSLVRIAYFDGYGVAANATP